jgi:hypothetical protein
MTELFNIKDGKIVITPDKLAIPVFKQIYERDKSKNKDIAFKELSYIFFMVDFNSPYQSYPNDKKEKMIIEDIFKDKWSPDKLVKEGITKYTEEEHKYILYTNIYRVDYISQSNEIIVNTLLNLFISYPITYINCFIS